MKANKLSLSALHTLALLLLLGLNGCAPEMIQEESNPRATLMLTTNLNTLGNSQSSEVNESSIKTLRVLVYEAFGSGDKITYGNKVGASNLTSTTEGANPVLKVEFKKCDQVAAFLIANEDPSWNLATKFIPAHQLKELAVAYNSTIAAPFKMYEETDVFSGQSDASRTVFLIRNVARVDVELTCKASEMSNLAEGGKLQLTQARIINMPKKSQLGQAIDEYTHDKGGYVDGEIIQFVENQNYLTTYNKDGVFTGFTTLNSDKKPGSLTFYVPEHFVKEITTYTYMTIEGKYYPQGSDKAINVIYTLPIGDKITTDKINGKEAFTAADLKIERNVQYLMKAKIKKIEQISDVVVSVKEWKQNTVSGSIEEDKKISLNVSSIQTSIAKKAENSTFIQFWSNQPSEQVRVLASGTLTKSGNANSESFAVNSVFTNLTDTEEQTQRPANLWFNNTAAPNQKDNSWGHLALKLTPGATISAGDVYTITLAAGTLHRTIKIEITE